MLTEGLKPASEYNYPNLRRMTDVTSMGSARFRFRFSPKAAQIINACPEILLQFRLSMRDDGSVVLYLKKGEPVCVVENEPQEIKEGQLLENVNCVAPEELPSDIKPEREVLADEYPAPFLPFDLDLVANACKEEIASLKSVPNTLQLNSSAFISYQIFHFLLCREKNPFSDRVRAVTSVLEVGGGIGTASFVASQFLPGAKVVSLELDQNLVLFQARLQQVLARRLGHNVSGVKIRNADFFKSEAGFIEQFDLLMGWFPLAHGIKDADMAKVFQYLRKGAFVVQFQSRSPLTAENAEGFGFKMVLAGDGLPACYVFERI